MNLSLSMASILTGELFTSTFDDFHVQGIVPTLSPVSGPLEGTSHGTWREEEGMTESKIAAKMSET